MTTSYLDFIFIGTAKTACSLVSVTDYTRNFPRVTIFPPDHGELECATVIFAILFMAKAIFADLDRAMIFHGVNLKGALPE